MFTFLWLYNDYCEISKFICLYCLLDVNFFWGIRQSYYVRLFNKKKLFLLVFEVWPAHWLSWRAAVFWPYKGSIIISSYRLSAYTLYLYSYSEHGSIYSGLYSCSLGYVREFLLLFLHWFPLNLIILKVDVAVFWV